MLIPLGILAASGAGGAAGAFEQIATTYPSATSTVTFTSIPQTYSHLVLRVAARSATSGGGQFTALTANNNTSGIYAFSRMTGSNNSMTRARSWYSNRITIADMPDAGASSGIFDAEEILILDYTSASKNKTVKALTGAHYESGGSFYHNVRFASGLIGTNDAITRLDFTTGNNFVSGTRVSLYGIKGA